MTDSKGGSTAEKGGAGHDLERFDHSVGRTSEARIGFKMDPIATSLRVGTLRLQQRQLDSHRRIGLRIWKRRELVGLAAAH
jgi:hypothetical protein